MSNMKQHSNIGNILRSLMMFPLVLVWHPIPTSAQEVENEKEFDYNEGGPLGPSNWGNIKKSAWAACKNGNMQSPIDISSNVKVNTATTSTHEFTTNYKPSNATLRNRGHDITLKWDIGQAGSIKINGIEYLLQQAHWHYPTEHAIDGQRYDVELHLVHSSADEKVNNSIAVVGILYKFGLPDPFLSKMAMDISALSKQTADRKVGVIDPREVGVQSENYYSYLGSLTTPNCLEGVLWIIMQRVRSVSGDQVTLLREAVHDPADNARPLQQINNRNVVLYQSI